MGLSGILAAVLFLSLLPWGCVAQSPSPAEFGREESKPEVSPFGVKPGTTMTEAEPIYAGRGEFRESWPLLSLGGPIPVEFTLHYTPDLWRRSPMTDGSFPFPPGYAVEAFTGSSVVRVVEFEDWDQDGHPVYANVFLGHDLVVLREVSPGVFEALESEAYALKKVGETYFFLDPVREWVLIFRSRALNWDMTHLGYLLRACGEVEWVFDRNGNYLKYSYGDHLNPTRVEDGLGRTLDFEYALTGDYQPYLASISDGRGRTVRFYYRETECDGRRATVLDGFADVAGNRTSFEVWDPARVRACALVSRIVSPLGNCAVDQEWNSFDRVVTAQRDAFGNETTLDNPWWGADPSDTTFFFPDGTERSFSHRGERYPLEYTDEAGKASHFQRDASSRLTGITDALGEMTALGRNACGKVSSVTDPLGNTTEFTYEPREQTFTRPGSREQAAFTFWDLSRVEEPDGTWTNFVRDVRGNVMSTTDASGDAWAFIYDASGRMTETTNPSGGTLAMTYHPDGTPASRTDPETGTTLYHQDAWGRPAGVTHPDGTGTQTERDAAGRPVAFRDEALGTTALTYDANGNVVGMTDPSGNPWAFAYDAMDRLSDVTDRTSATTTQSYNAFGNPTTTVDATGLSTSYTYDPRGWYASQTTGGATISGTRDAEGRSAGLTEPGGAYSALTRDASGRLTALTDPLGRTTAFSFDASGAVTSIADASGDLTSVEYDARGLPIKISHPGGLTATLTRGPGGKITQVEGPAGGKHRYEYSPMGRLSCSRDPLDRETRTTYDARGRGAATAFPDGETVTRTFDPTGNLLRRLYSKGPDLNFTHDAAGRLTSAEGVAIQMDGEGRITGAHYGPTELTATYDAAGRLTGLGYPNGMRVTYAYSAQTGLLARASDDTSGAWVEIHYGPDLLPAAWTRSNGVTGVWDWDAAGQLTRVREGTFLDLTYAYDAAGRVASVAGTWPLDPASAFSPEEADWAYDAGSQILGGGCAYDPRGRQTAAPGHAFRWDGASRLIGCDGAELAYDGLDHLAARTDGGQTTTYFPHPALPDSPTVAEIAPDGTGTFFIYLPTGELAYAVTEGPGEAPPTVSFYHFDRSGHTLALTDGTGAVTDRYAYDPYGRLLIHAGGGDQPFTFQGRWGTRQEGSSGELFQAGVRTYHAGQGRFLTPDPTGLDPLDPRTLNPYAFAYQNPVTLGDWTGFSPWQADALRRLGLSSPAVDRLEELERELDSLEDALHASYDESFSLWEVAQAETRWGLQRLAWNYGQRYLPSWGWDTRPYRDLSVGRRVLKHALKRLPELMDQNAALRDAVKAKEAAIKMHLDEIGKTVRCMFRKESEAERTLKRLTQNFLLHYEDAMRTKDYDEARRLLIEFGETTQPFVSEKQAKEQHFSDLHRVIYGY